MATTRHDLTGPTHEVRRPDADPIAVLEDAVAAKLAAAGVADRPVPAGRDPDRHRAAIGDLRHAAGQRRASR